jgi:hypothetical protein
MKPFKKLLTEIYDLTRDIETNYPELYQYLDENPVTIPNIAHPKIGAKELEDYLNTLKDLLEKRKNSTK